MTQIGSVVVLAVVFVVVIGIVPRLGQGGRGGDVDIHHGLGRRRRLGRRQGGDRGSDRDTQGRDRGDNRADDAKPHPPRLGVEPSSAVTVRLRPWGPAGRGHAGQMQPGLRRHTVFGVAQREGTA